MVGRRAALESDTARVRGLSYPLGGQFDSSFFRSVFGIVFVPITVVRGGWGVIGLDTLCLVLDKGEYAPFGVLGGILRFIGSCLHRAVVGVSTFKRRCQWTIVFFTSTGFIYAICGLPSQIIERLSGLVSGFFRASFVFSQFSFGFNLLWGFVVSLVFVRIGCVLGLRGVLCRYISFTPNFINNTKVVFLIVSGYFLRRVRTSRSCVEREWDLLVRLLIAIGR